MKKILEFLKKHQLSLFSSSTSFYMMVALFSLFILLIQFYNFFNNDNFIINKIIKILNPYYVSSIERVIPLFSLNKISPIIFLNLLWSSSKYINGFNKVCDLIYHYEKKRNFLINRISSIFIFLIIIIVLIVEVIIILFANKLINIFVNNLFIYYILQLIIEFFLIYSLIIILNIYSPPKKLKIKEIYKGCFVSTCIIYICLILFLVIIIFLQKLKINILSIISLFFLLLYFINASLMIGFLINYYIQK